MGEVSGFPRGVNTWTTSLIISRTCPWPTHRPWSGGSRLNPATTSLSFSFRPSQSVTALGLRRLTAVGVTVGSHGTAALAALRASRVYAGRGELLRLTNCWSFPSSLRLRAPGPVWCTEGAMACVLPVSCECWMTLAEEEVDAALGFAWAGPLAARPLAISTAAAASDTAMDGRLVMETPECVRRPLGTL